MSARPRPELVTSSIPAATPGATTPWPGALRRVVVVGTSCSGKSTLAAALARTLGTHAVHLDHLYWGPGWSETPEAEFRRATRQAVAAEAWVVDGNYQLVRDIVWPRATAVVWLDYPFHVVAMRALRRTLRRVRSREVLFGGNRETFRHAFLSRDSILLWVVRSHWANRRRYAALRHGGPYDHLTWYRMASPADAEGFLHSSAAGAAGAGHVVGAHQPLNRRPV